ncbi:TonB-dependent receptor [Arenibacter sp. F20364]|uniref:SusC/RagA family TonB-linked outer membrane protein n=1 Tax=Arenibacter sp. F20364 TaxID=2926415 RepID=UPI001FF31C9A|nr:TonB-dependent receptor [Arenibacter sp. F20364]MCK0191573.1 TonB-dependent receptor [Arenibacter sp. F20364]|tara:strand:+ start:2665 stop:5784 length:3120 start_codon:yes stop_codon:yes gene_type:complete
MNIKILSVTLVFILLGCSLSYAQEITISGTVTSSVDNQPLPGANVILKNGLVGTTTDFDGKYTFNVSSQSDILVYSYQGYTTTEVVVGSQKIIDIGLDEDVSNLDEVVIIGYGSSRRKDLTGSITSIKSEDLEAVKATTADDFVQGRVSGLLLTQTSGQPGGATSVRIRGSSSINASNEPLYVIDGFPVSNSGSSAGVSDGPSLNALATISPNDIESIDVLKDASATAIYGSRGANGVIIITTKRGSSGETQINYETYMGVSKVTKELELLDASQFAHYYNESIYNGSGRPRFYTSPTDWGKGTDWQDEIFRTAITTSHDLSIKGGGNEVRYAISGSYLDQEGTIIDSDFNRYNLRINLDVKATEKLSIENTTSLSRSDYNTAQTDTPGGTNINSSTIGAYGMSPLVPVFDAQGNYTKGDFIMQNDGTFVNDVSNVQEYLPDFASPVAYIKLNESRGRSTRILENLALKWNFAKNLTLKTSLGADVTINEETSFATAALDFGNENAAIANQAKLVSSNLLSETTMNYVNTFNYVHQLNVLAGISWQDFEIRGTYANALGLPTENFGANTFAGATTPGVNSLVVDNFLHSYFGRANYIYDGRYILTASFRADGSSKFGDGQKFGYFPSGAFAWNISEENFMQNSKVYMKLRLGYGIVGNQEIGSYRSKDSYIPTYHTFNRTPVVGQLPRTPANADLRWEQTEQYNIGLDLGFFNDRLSLTADVYRKNTEDLLLELPVPYETGYFSSLVNVGSVQNQGAELAINSSNIQGKFKWDSNLTVGYNKNEILNLAGVNEIPTGATINGIQNWQLLVEGGEIGAFYGYVSDGIIQLSDTPENTPQFITDTFTPGERKYKDLNGDGVINADNDRAFLGNPIPELTFGLNNSFNWNGFDLNIFLNGVYGNEIVNFTRAYLENFNGRNNVLLTSFSNRWTPENPSNTYTRSSNGIRNAPFASNYVEDGSFLRLKSVTLGYSFASDFLSTMDINKIRLYVTGKNLHIWTNYSGVDPEVSWGGPDSALSAGADFGGYPTSKTILLGLNVNF